MESPGDRWATKVIGLNLEADAQSREPGNVVRLVVAHRHDELRDACRQTLAAGADAAVMDDRGGARKDLAERDEAEMGHVWRQSCRKLIGVFRDQQAAAPQQATGL